MKSKLVGEDVLLEGRDRSRELGKALRALERNRLGRTHISCYGITDPHPFASITFSAPFDVVSKRQILVRMPNTKPEERIPEAEFVERAKTQIRKALNGEEVDVSVSVLNSRWRSVIRQIGEDLRI